jgi:hypothetical protein
VARWRGPEVDAVARWRGPEVDAVARWRGPEVDAVARPGAMFPNHQRASRAKQNATKFQKYLLRTQ